MTREQALEQMAEAIKNGDEGDPEAAHSQADGVLCRLLISLGYADVVEEWEKVYKWYA